MGSEKQALDVDRRVRVLLREPLDEPVIIRDSDAAFDIVVSPGPDPPYTGPVVVRLTEATVRDGDIYFIGQIERSLPADGDDTTAESTTDTESSATPASTSTSSMTDSDAHDQTDQSDTGSHNSGHSSMAGVDVDPSEFGLGEDLEVDDDEDSLIEQANKKASLQGREPTIDPKLSGHDGPDDDIDAHEER